MSAVRQILMWVSAAGMLSVVTFAITYGIVERLSDPEKRRDCLVHTTSGALNSGELLVVEGKLYVCGYHPDGRPYDYLCEPMQRWSCP